MTPEAALVVRVTLMLLYPQEEAVRSITRLPDPKTEQVRWVLGRD
jgi:hypothetical protein